MIKETIRNPYVWTISTKMRYIHL